MTTQAAIEKLKEATYSLPQNIDGLITRHHFADGLYCRELFRPADRLIVGKKHKKAHIYIVVQGEVTITWAGKEPERVVGPKVFACPAGTQRAVYAHTDALCLTVHPTEATEVADAEDDLIEHDPNSQFITGNQLKALP